MLRWMDGFEQYGLNETHMLEGVGGAAAWSDRTGWDLSTVNPATGTHHVRVGDGPGTSLRRALGQSVDTAGVGYRCSISDLPGTASLDPLNEALVMLGFRDVSDTRQSRIVMGTEGSVMALRGSTLLGQSDPCIAAGGYHHFEAKGKMDPTTGFIEVRVNEVTVLNLTGIDTTSTSNNEVSQINIGVSGSGIDGDAGFTSFDLDDIYAWDTDASDAENTVVDFVGDKGCYYLPVNADTAEADWTKSTGVTGYSLLDETTPDDADYIANTTGTARSIFGVAALPGNIAEVIAMMPVIRARKEESGTVTMRGGVVVGVDESYTPDTSPSTAFAYITPGPKTIDPATGVAWANDANPDLLIERTA